MIRWLVKPASALILLVGDPPQARTYRVLNGARNPLIEINQVWPAAASSTNIFCKGSFYKQKGNVML